eukprot:431239_1
MAQPPHNCNWKKLLIPPLQLEVKAHQNFDYRILPWNNRELLVFTTNGYLPKDITIWTYNILNDKYKELMSLTNIYELIDYYTISLHDNKSLLYLFGESGKIIKINLKTKQFEISNESYDDGS